MTIPSIIMQSPPSWQSHSPWRSQWIRRSQSTVYDIQNHHNGNLYTKGRRNLYVINSDHTVPVAAKADWLTVPGRTFETADTHFVYQNKIGNRDTRINMFLNAWNVSRLMGPILEELFNVCCHSYACDEGSISEDDLSLVVITLKELYCMCFIPVTRGVSVKTNSPWWSLL